MLRAVNGEDDRFESFDHAYSQGLIDAKKQPPQVTVNPPGPSLGAAPMALLSLLLGAALASLFFLSQGNSSSTPPVVEEKTQGPLIHQYFDSAPTQGPGGTETPPAVNPPPTDEGDDSGAEEPTDSELVLAEGDEPADDSGTSSGSSTPPRDTSGDSSSPPRQESGGGNSPTPIEGSDSEPEPEPTEPEPEPAQTTGPVRSLVGGLGEAVDGTTDTLGDVVCGLLCVD